jgi:uncharacterized delta-60 repeat protein
MLPLTYKYFAIFPMLRGVVMHARLFWCFSLGIFSLMTGCLPACAFSRLDATFGLNGRVAVELGVKSSGHAVLVQPDGKIVVAGSSVGAKGGGMNFSLVRFHPDGSLDTTFNGEGSVVTSLVAGDDEALALGLLSDGRIVVGGYSHNGVDRDFALACYRSDGVLDRRFGVDGAVLTSIGNGNEEITALAVNKADQITAVGSTEGTAGKALAVVRYRADGSLDSSFGEQGVSLLGVGGDANAEGLVERDDGSLVISGSYQEKKNSAAMLVGLRGDGMVDATFGDKGVAAVSSGFAASEGYRLAEDRDGMLYLVGAVGPLGKRDAALFRFTRNGKPDPGFGKNGAVVSAISAGDDVLYDVCVGPNGVAASGFAMENNGRQFLLASYLTDGSVMAASGTGRSGGDAAAGDPAPVQEVRVNGRTKVLIRKLQMWNSEMQLRQMQVSDSFSRTTTLWQGPVHGAQGLWGDRSTSPIVRSWSDFLAAGAWAADGAGADHIAGVLDSRTVTTGFSEGESVGYALTTDARGNVIVVGTAEDGGASSIVAARFAADDPVDRIVDQPGHRSSHITTTLSADVARTTLTTGGEIGEAFGKTVVRRGVVFSVKEGPLYRNPVSAATDSGLRRLAAFWVADAVAADGSSTAVSTPTGERVVEEGVTDDGPGSGVFTTLLEHLQPGAVYYIRAYALTADNAVYYGNQISVRTADACFIATASFGSLLHPCVEILRDFRDQYLVGRVGGQQLVEWYYTLSPPVADVVAGNAALRLLVRLLLLPVIGFSWLAVQGGMGAALATLVATAAIIVRCRRRGMRF